jgi:hypothetical protein
MEDTTVVDRNVFKASRWTRGNLLFPVRIEITRQHIVRIKPKLIGSEEESIAISKVASVNIKTGWFWAEIRIDSSAGASPITSHGHWKKDARQIRALVERFQQA